MISSPRCKKKFGTGIGEAEKKSFLLATAHGERRTSPEIFKGGEGVGVLISLVSTRGIENLLLLKKGGKRSVSMGEEEERIERGRGSHSQGGEGGGERSFPRAKRNNSPNGTSKRTYTPYERMVHLGFSHKEEALACPNRSSDRRGEGTPCFFNH